MSVFFRRRGVPPTPPQPTVDYKTWYFNDTINSTLSKTRANFYTEYNGRKVYWYYLRATSLFNMRNVEYFDEDDVNTVAYNSSSGWTEQYRTIYFDAVPTGTLRTWLEANATAI